MKSLRLFFLLLPIAALATGCVTITRTETDEYTITQRDTTIREDVHNAPGDRDGGTIYPSPRTVEITRRYVQQDSIVNRYYPAFLRLGGIEAVSFLAPGGSDRGGSHGLFGLYDLLTAKRTDDSKIFTANMFRIAPYEWRLRWFRDAPNWTLGTSAFEMFIQQQDSSAELKPGEMLMSFTPFYLRKRFFFREEPPYIMLVPYFGLSYFPSQYINVGASLDVGSYGGFNFRAYAGVVTGGWGLFPDTRNGLFDIRGNRFGPPQISTSDFNLTFPYFGLGVSALDFVNRTEELFIEWKDHDHSALEVSGLNFDMVKSLSGSEPFFGQTDSASTSGGTTFTGMVLRLASATYPLPIGERRFYVGTSLFNLMALSSTEIGFGFLPIRAGYRFDVLYDELNLEPFVELNYYPSTMLHAGARLSLTVTEWMQLNALLGYVNGSTNLDVLSGLEDLQVEDAFSTGYIGIGIGIGDVFHTPEEVMRK